MYQSQVCDNHMRTKGSRLQYPLTLLFLGEIVLETSLEFQFKPQIEVPISFLGYLLMNKI